MLKKFLASCLMLTACAGAYAQENTINRIPEVGKDNTQNVYTDYDKGFWCAGDLLGGYSMNMTGHNMAFAEIDYNAGYRFNEFLKVGAGLGCRYYFDQEYLRRGDIKLAMPIYATVRGNFMPGKYRTVVPFYSFDIGGTVRDGFMVRPAVGIRVGEPRKAFTASIVYMGQNNLIYNNLGEKANKFRSFVALRLGFEY